MLNPCNRFQLFISTGNVSFPFFLETLFLSRKFYRIPCRSRELSVFTDLGLGSIPGQGTKISSSHEAQPKKERKKKKSIIKQVKILSHYIYYYTRFHRWISSRLCCSFSLNFPSNSLLVINSCKTHQLIF